MPRDGAAKHLASQIPVSAYRKELGNRQLQLKAVQHSQVLRVELTGLEIGEERRVLRRKRRKLHWEGEPRQQLIARYSRCSAPEPRREPATTEGSAKPVGGLLIQRREARLQQQGVLAEPQLERPLCPRRRRKGLHRAAPARPHPALDAPGDRDATTSHVVSFEVRGEPSDDLGAEFGPFLSQ